MRGLPTLRSGEPNKCSFHKKANRFAADLLFYSRLLTKVKLSTLSGIKKAGIENSCFLLWAMRGSNPRPPRCKRGALNQLS